MTRREIIKRGISTTLLLPLPFWLRHSKNDTMNTGKQFDVIIIGGSYSGLSAAMALGRSLRKVLIIDGGMPCNRQTPHSHNFITQDGKKPHEIALEAKAQVLEYDSVQFLPAKASKGKQTDSGFEIETETGQKFTAKKLIFATGIRDIMPNIKGFSDCWGISVVHCPYCHGYEIRHKKTGIMAKREHAFHLSPMVKNLTDDVTILASGKADFAPEELTKFKENDIKIIEKEVVEIEHSNGQLKHVVFADNTKESFEAVYAAIPFEQHSDIPESLGCALTEEGYIEVDMMNKTTIDGMFACGDNSSRLRSVANAVASGNIAGAVANMELANEEF